MCACACFVYMHEHVCECAVVNVHECAVVEAIPEFSRIRMDHLDLIFCLFSMLVVYQYLLHFTH